VDEVKNLLDECQIDGIMSEDKINNLLSVATILVGKIELLEQQIADLQSLREG
jgi:hypothetical protein